MNSKDFLNILQKIKNEHSETVFASSQKIYAILLDLVSEEETKERLLIRHFIEVGGYSALQRANAANTATATAKIIDKLHNEFSLEISAATWVTNLFCTFLQLDVSAEPSFLLPKNSYKTAKNNYSSAVAIGKSHTVALLKDGTVVANGSNDFLQCDVESWHFVVAVAAGDDHTIGLTNKGRVLATGKNNHDQCGAAHLENVTAIYAFANDTICLHHDGTAVAFGKSNLDLSHFEQIKTISWHPEGVYGIRQDGSVVLSAAGWEEEQWAKSLTNVSQIISTYVMGSVVLTNDGKIYKMNEPASYFAPFHDIIAITDLTDGFAILRADGKVRILNYFRDEKRIVSAADKWHNITAIFGKYKRLIALTADERLLATCTDPDWLQRNGSLDFVQNWHPVGGSQLSQIQQNSPVKDE
ncbi:MAG: RCC1 domain-containing protein [Defluviitaleaceae bacterium]|nr:RCC1 domain-containing protein [Defluviitaleaceae bacterium]